MLPLFMLEWFTGQSLVEEKHNYFPENKKEGPKRRDGKSHQGIGEEHLSGVLIHQDPLGRKLLWREDPSDLSAVIHLTTQSSIFIWWWV